MGKEFKMEKTVLVLVDGMRPDGMLQCGHPYPEQLCTRSAYALDAQTVLPSATLPCHMSLFHSVDPDRHGILTNTYVPPVRPINGLFEQLNQYGKKCAFFNTWEELRDLSRPDQLHTYVCLSQHKQSDTDTKITDAAIDYINREEPDFMFLYLGETDEVGGHSVGWMSEQYLKCLYKAWGCIERLHASIPKDYTLIVLADHGGHDRTHGTNMPEDMTIPLLCCGPTFPCGSTLKGASIKDVAVTVAALLEVPPAREWEGKCLFS